MTESGQPRYWNNAFEALTGYTQDDLAGAPALSDLVVGGDLPMTAVGEGPFHAQVRARDGIGAAAVDYLPFSRRVEAREIARRIAALGIAPWVATPELDVLGVGSLEIVPRRILALYDSAEEPHLPLSSVHRFIATPLEHLGYAVDYADVRGPLPEDPLAGRYAGIVSWFNDDELEGSERYRAWILRQLDAGIRLAAFDHLGIYADPAFLSGEHTLPRLEVGS